MSFILDALKKSEHERQRQGSTEFASVPTSTEPTGAPRWLWIVIALLAINLAVLAGLLLRPETATPIANETAVTAAPVTTAAARPTEPTFAERLADARQDIPRQNSAEQPANTPTLTPTVAEPDVVTQDPASIDRSNLYSTYQEVLASGAVNVAPLHLDIHVFSETPADRFVFINMAKHREGSRLDEGPLVSEIRPDGVVLEHRGISFLLTRD